MQPQVIIVGADKGGVGKSTVARTLMGYFITAHREPRAFDTEYRKFDTEQRGVLKRFFPAQTEVVDFTESDGHVRVLDSLQSSPLTIIDIRAGIMRDSLQMLSDLGFLEMSKSGEIKIATMHVLDGSMAALDEIAEAARLLSNERHYLVRNHHINEREFFDWNPTRAAQVGGNIIDIPKLDKRAAEAVDESGLPFEQFVRESKSLVMRGYVRHWLGLVHAQYDSSGINSL